MYICGTQRLTAVLQPPRILQKNLHAPWCTQFVTQWVWAFSIYVYPKEMPFSYPDQWVFGMQRSVWKLQRFVRRGRDFTPFWVAICLQVKCIAVPIRANYERGDLPWHGDVRQDLVCLCRTEKVEPTLVSTIFISGFSSAFGSKLPGYSFMGTCLGSYLYEVLYCCGSWQMPCSDRCTYYLLFPFPVWISIAPVPREQATENHRMFGLKGTSRVFYVQSLC